MYIIKKNIIKIYELVLLLLATTLTIFSPDLNAAFIQGYVKDPGGKSIDSVMVNLLELKKVTYTNLQGRFTFVNIEAGSYTISFEHPRFNEIRKSVIITSDLDTINIEITLLPKEYVTPTIEVKEKIEKSRFDELLELTNTIEGQQLERKLSTTIATTLKDEIGISIRSMGPAPSRPVYRGLSSDRILITEDDIKTNDLSATSPDHAVTIETFNIKRIEIIRGPRVLLKTSTSVGGIVEAIRNEIPLELTPEVSTYSGFYFESANQGYLYSVNAEIPLFQTVQLNGEVTRRKTEDLKTPIGTLRNSSINNINYCFGGSLIKNDFLVGMSFRSYTNNYGIPGGFIGAHPFGVNIDMTKDQFIIKLLKKDISQKIKSLSFDFSRSYYNHKEFEAANIIGAEFAVTDYIGFLTLDYKVNNKMNTGTITSGVELRDFNVGAYVFTPPSKLLNFNIATYHNFQFPFNISLEISLRYDYNYINPNPRNPFSNIGFISSRVFNIYSLSGTIIKDFTEHLGLGINLSKSSRIPTIEELYSEGPHLASYSYEIGNPYLESERGIGTELFVQYKYDQLSGILSFFRNDFGYYIIPRATGQINYATLLPIYKTFGTPALLYGLEFQNDIRLGSALKWKNSFSYTFGKIKETDSPLPMIPPAKGITGIEYKVAKFTVGINCEYAFAQNRTDEFEQPTKGYAIFNLYSQLLLQTGRFIHNLSLSIDNLLNKEYRNHLSRVKSIMPETGFNFRITYKIFY
ncbi:MAG: TonB-dependent receptor [Ignavibacteria bacterium]